MPIMKTYPIRADRVSLALTVTGGHLSDVAFDLDGRHVTPMHTAPWYDEPMPPDAPPMLRVLRGDFFCAPFGPNDVVPGDGPQHGDSASGEWELVSSGDGWVEAVLATPIMGAQLRKRVEVRPGESIVYQRHTFTGGSGRLPVGHHAMLRADGVLRLAFAPRIFAGTPPAPVETPPEGRSILAYPQEITDLRTARRGDGGTIDLTSYPTEDGHEDLWMLASDPVPGFAWTAATSEDGWVWFGIKNPRILPGTVIWQSNGGRSYPPFSSRHRRVIGLEEVCSWFHLGHAASTGDNPLAARGVPTAISLRPDGTVVIPYLFGLAAVPADFGPVASITEDDGGVLIADESGREAFAACDVSFVTNP
jgi:hypothetical protein